ncbi:MAG: Asp-tRNA(Asn)/Glu-tRNA(Gln) amidotransferase subunit GatC [Candidatus Gracilibacteria bacterium]|nr:Asp-tRNA(Asn)/Glu-tRNA(Gln) amidotransferase subunit GatC [Candidatus Gracilibacteria bacterium]MDD2908752.1 Asp-tRNA(Asn)/Glu-tRNA(Gln) amidotransferase subunit GatC [Candidatus Gracilibacteria bacterium]
MSLTQEQVKHIANLSRLQLNSDEVASFQKNLNSIVEYVDILEKVPEDELRSVDNNILDILPLRKDEIKPGIISSREDLLKCSSKKIINHSIAIGNIM